jgi:hypothetical protein
VSGLVTQSEQHPASSSPPETDASESHGGGDDHDHGRAGEEGLGRLTVLSLGGMIGFLGWTGARRWRAGRVGKSSKLV